MRRILLLCTALLVPMRVSAEVRLCDGMWTNGPCSSTPVATIAELAAEPRPTTAVDPQDGLKRSIYHDLDMLRLSARREHDIAVDISEARETCLKPGHSVGTCRETADRLEEKLTRRIRDATEREDRIARDAMRKEEERRAREEASSIRSIEQTNIIINNNLVVATATPRWYRPPSGFGGSQHDAMGFKKADPKLLPPLPSR